MFFTKPAIKLIIKPLGVEDWVSTRIKVVTDRPDDISRLHVLPLIKEGRHETLRNVSLDWPRKGYTNNSNNGP